MNVLTDFERIARARAINWLGRYIQHLESCASRAWWRRRCYCDCGVYEALERARG